MNNRPILYNGMIISRTYIIEKNIEVNKDFEVYELNSKKKLVLFKNLSVYFLEKHFSLRVLYVGEIVYYYAVLDESVNINNIRRRIENIIKPRGFDAIVGMDDTKNVFINDIINPLNEKEIYERFKVKLPNAILLFGPPGCGKTYFVEKLSEELGFSFIKTSQADFGSTYIHGTSLKIKEVFDKARSSAPSILFIDEIDSLFPKRLNLGSESSHKQEEINEFLVQMNNIGSYQVILIVATNQPSLLDDAILRTGRIDKLIHIGLPNFNDRKLLFKFYFRDRPTKNIDYDKLADNTKGYNNSDINYITNESAKNAIEKSRQFIDTDLILEIIEKTPPSITKEQIEMFKRFSIQERK